MQEFNAVIAAVGVLVTAWAAWSTTRATRARRRAEESQLAWELLSATQKGRERSIQPDPAAEVRLEHAARFATHEFTRLMLHDGPKWSLILPAALYGAALLVASQFTPEPAGVLVFITMGIIFIVSACVAGFLKVSRGQRLRDAGVHVPRALDLWRREKFDLSLIVRSINRGRHTR